MDINIYDAVGNTQQYFHYYLLEAVYYAEEGHLVHESVQNSHAVRRTKQDLSITESTLIQPSLSL